MSAAVRFRPVPPAFKEMQNTGTSFVAKLSTNCMGWIARRSGWMEAILDYEENGQSGVCGEIQVRGYNVMQGYYKKPEENKKVFTEDGWLKTGNIGYLDECGRLRITGRLKEMIIRAGENIAPQEIEEVIRLFDGVDGVKVIGIPAEVLQEEIVACIVAKQGYPISKEALQAFVRSRLADYKVPAHVLQFTELPMNASGKIDIKQLKKLVQERICMGKK